MSREPTELQAALIRTVAHEAELLDEVDNLRAAVAAVRKLCEPVRTRIDMSTHYDGCWARHAECFAHRVQLALDAALGANQ